MDNGLNKPSPNAGHEPKASSSVRRVVWVEEKQLDLGKNCELGGMTSMTLM